MTDWTTYPKTELHLHLEGAAPPAFIRDLAQERGVDLSSVLDESGYVWSDFASFLETYMAVCGVLKGPDDFARLTEAVLAASVANGVVYTEIILSPDICGGGDPVAWAEHLAAIEDAADRVPEIDVRFMAACIRNLGPEQAERIAQVAVESRRGRLTGFNMAGEERVHHPSDFVRAFDIARDGGLRLTCHAGELAGAQSVRDALDHLRPDRIGHGVRAIEDPALVTRLAQEGVLLEVCPGSNVAVGVFPDLGRHPVARLRDAGVRIAISTDDPPYFHTTMTAEYAALSGQFGWSGATFDAINRDSMKAAFCDESTRHSVLLRLEART